VWCERERVSNEIETERRGGLRLGKRRGEVEKKRG